MPFKAPRGTEDALPVAIHSWQWLEREFREVTRVYGYREIRTPVFEETEIFTRTAGETSEVVTKQMYTFEDKGGRSVTLKPESTAPAMRAVLEHNLCPTGATLRLCYISSPHYRYERPQKGRLREHHQCGIELVGSSSAAADAEVIEVGFRFLERIGLTGLVVQLNSIGRSECREAYRQVVLNHFAPLIAARGDEFAEQANRNPLRLLDSKDPDIQAAAEGIAPITDYLEADSAQRFADLQAMLTEAGVNFRVAPEIVRGLDYYTETVFEILSTDLGAQSAVLAGGRYDHLIKDLGGPDMPSVGFGSGVERLLLVLEARGLLPAVENPAVFIVYSPEALNASLKLARELRQFGIEVGLDLDARSFKSQFRQADKSGATWVAVLGEVELESETVTIKELSTGNQETLPRIEAIARLGSER